jgi:hypothetical protein
MESRARLRGIAGHRATSSIRENAFRARWAISPHMSFRDGFRGALAVLLLTLGGAGAAGCSAAPSDEATGAAESALAMPVMYQEGKCVLGSAQGWSCTDPATLKELVALGCSASAQYYEFDPWTVGASPTRLLVHLCTDTPAVRARVAAHADAFTLGTTLTGSCIAAAPAGSIYLSYTPVIVTVPYPYVCSGNCPWVKEMPDTELPSDGPLTPVTPIAPPHSP